MSFFGNDAVNRVNLHYGVQALATSGGGVFIAVFLVRAGLSPAAALALLSAVFALRFVARPAMLPLAKRLGMKPLLIAGALALAVPYALLPAVPNHPAALAALVGALALADILYWPAYNAYFAAIGDAEHRGHQIGAREALAAVAGVVAPLAVGLGLARLGALATFAGVAAVQAAASLPLFGAPAMAVAARATTDWRAARPALALGLADGWMDGGLLFVWQIALFLTLKQSFAGYGAAMALAGLAGAAGGLLLGRHVDAGHGRRAVAIAAGVTAAVLLMRALSLDWPPLAIGANALGALAMALFIPAFATVGYNMGQAAACPYRFYLAAEGAWDVGCAGACLLAAGLFAAGAATSVILTLALPALGAAGWIARRYYGGGYGAPSR